MGDSLASTAPMTWEWFDDMVTLACAELAVCLILAAEALYTELRGGEEAQANP